MLSPSPAEIEMVEVITTQPSRSRASRLGASLLSVPVVYQYDALVTQVQAVCAVCVPQCVHVFICAYVYLSECGAWTRGIVRQAIGFSLCWCEFDHLQCVFVVHSLSIAEITKQSTPEAAGR